jgi:hypothetical protein
VVADRAMVQMRGSRETSSTEMRRKQRAAAAASYGLLGAIGLAVTAALIVFGLILLARKS